MWIVAPSPNTTKTCYLGDQMPFQI